MIGHSVSVMTVQASAVRRRLRPTRWSSARRWRPSRRWVGRRWPRCAAWSVSCGRRATPRARACARAIAAGPPGRTVPGVGTARSALGDGRRRASSLRGWTSRHTGWCRRASPTPCGTPTDPHGAEVAVSYGDDRLEVAVRDDGQAASDAWRPDETRQRSARDARTRGRVRRLARGAEPARGRLRAGRLRCPWSRHELPSGDDVGSGPDHGARGRRPGAGALRLPDDPRDRAGPAGGRRGRRRRAGRFPGRVPAPRRRADGRPDARCRRDRGHPDAHGRPGVPGARGDADDLRHGRVRLRGVARRGERVPAQGRPAGAAGGRHPGRARGRVTAGADSHPANDRVVRGSSTGRRPDVRPPSSPR